MDDQIPTTDTTPNTTTIDAGNDAAIKAIRAKMKTLPHPHTLYMSEEDIAQLPANEQVKINAFRERRMSTRTRREEAQAKREAQAKLQREEAARLKEERKAAKEAEKAAIEAARKTEENTADEALVEALVAGGLEITS